MGSTLAKHPRQILPLALLALFLLAGCLSPSPTATVPPTATETPEVVVEIVEGPHQVIVCLCGLQVYLIEPLPNDYTLTLTVPDGTSEQVHCVDGRPDGYPHHDDQESKIDGSVCWTSKAHIPDITPDTVTVTLAWDGNEATQVFQPEYLLLTDPACPPKCLHDLVLFDEHKRP